MIDERSISRYICKDAIYRIYAAYGGELRENREVVSIQKNRRIVLSTKEV